MGVGKILFEIDTKLGPGGLSSLKSALDMIGSLASGVKDAVKELDKFKVVMNQVDMSIINYADSAVKGQIDTFQLMKSMQSLNKAGLEVTDKQFKTLAARATDLAQATGQDATEAFKRLTDAIAKGQNRALAEYGIKLQTSIDLHKTQKEALAAMTEGFEDLEIKLETNSERLYALNNNWDTFKGALWATSGAIPGVSTGLDKLNEILGDTNKAISETPQAIHSWLREWENVASVMNIGLQALRGNVQLVALEFSGLVNKIASDPNLWKAVESELYQKKMAGFDEQYWVEKTKSPEIGVDVFKGKEGRGGGKAQGVEVAMGISPDAARWAESLNIPITPETIGDLERLASRLRGNLGLEGPATERRTGQGFGEADWSAASASVDEKMAELINLEERRSHVQQNALDSLKEYMSLRDEELLSMQEVQLYQEHRLTLLQDEEYQESRLAEMRQNEQIYEAEREIYMMYEREQALDFAHQFEITWSRTYRTISAGATAVGHMQDLLKSSWASLVTSVIKGSGSWKAALREVLIAKGISIAIEEGWLALQDYFAAASAFARRQYAKGIKLLASGASHTALAAIAGAASGVASRLGGSGGGSASSSASSYSATPTFGSSDGGYGREQQEVKINIYMDDSASFFGAVVEQNTSARRSGATSFKTDEAA